MKKKRDWSKVADEPCTCGAKKSEHVGLQHHLGCARTKCQRFTWKCFLDARRKKVR